MATVPQSAAETAEVNRDVRTPEALLKTGALQSAIFNSANFSSIATDAKGVIQIFNVGAERMLGYAAAEVMNTITPANIVTARRITEQDRYRPNGYVASIMEKAAFDSDRFMAEVRRAVAGRHSAA